MVYGMEIRDGGCGALYTKGGRDGRGRGGLYRWRDGRGRVGLVVAEAVATSVREESKKSGKEEQQKTTRKIDPLVEKSIVLQSRQNNYNLSVEYDSATARYTTLKFDITSGLGVGGGGQRRWKEDWSDTRVFDRLGTGSS